MIVIGYINIISTGNVILINKLKPKFGINEVKDTKRIGYKLFVRNIC